MPPPQTAKLLGSRRRRLLAFAAAAAIVALGMLARPRQPADRAPTAEESATPMLQALVEEREPIRIFRALRARADEVMPSVARMDCAASEAPPAGPDWSGVATPARERPRFAVSVAPGAFLVEAPVERRECVLALPGAASAVPVSPPGGLAIVPGESRAPVARVSSILPIPGQIVFIVGPGRNGRILSPVFVVRADEASAELSAAPAAAHSGPLFDADGRLTAFVRGNGEAIPIAAAIELARSAAALRPAARVSLGLTTQPITAALSAFVGADGVLVADVVGDGPAARAGIEPGDVIVAVGGAATATPQDLAARLGSLAAGPVDVTIVRGGRRRALTVDAVPRRPDEGVGRPRGREPKVISLEGLAIARAARARPAGQLVYVEEDGVRFFVVRPQPPSRR